MVEANRAVPRRIPLAIETWHLETNFVQEAKHIIRPTLDVNERKLTTWSLMATPYLKIKNIRGISDCYRNMNISKKRLANRHQWAKWSQLFIIKS